MVMIPINYLPPSKQYILRDCLDILLTRLSDVESSNILTKEKLSFRERTMVDFALGELAEMLCGINKRELIANEDESLEVSSYKKRWERVLNLREITGAVGLSEEVTHS